MRNGIQCSVLRSTAELEAFAPTWRDLWRRDPAATPFQSPEWLLPWWHQFGQPDLRCMVLSRDGSAIGLLPFYVLDAPRRGERQMLPLGVSTTDYLDGVFAPECGIDDIARALDGLRSEAGCDWMSAPQLRAESKLCRAFELSHGAKRINSDACSRMPAMSIAELPQKLRAHVRYYSNRAQRTGEITLTVAHERDWEESFATLEHLHTQRWQERGEEGVLADPRVAAWHREVLPLLLAGGMLRLCCLRLNGEIVAAAYSLADPEWRSERTEYVYLTTFSTQHAEIRPGTLLLAREMERATREGIKTIDMLRGEETYKQTIWHTQRTPTFGFSLQNKARSEDRTIGAVA